MRMHLGGGSSDLDRLWSGTSADRRRVRVHVGPGVILGCLKVEVGICLAAIPRRVLESVNKGTSLLSGTSHTDTQNHNITLRDRVPLES